MADLALQSDDESEAPALSAALATAKTRDRAGDDGLIGAETLKLGIETRHLRLRYFDERLSVALKLMAVVAGALVLAGLAAMAWSASEDRALVVEPFSTPPAFAARGITGEVVAGDVADRLAAITRTVNAESFMPSSEIAADEKREVKLEIPETGVSIGDLWRALVGWLGHERPISGSLRETTDGRIVLVARVAGHDPIVLAGAPADLDRLEQALAERLFQAADPVNWAISLAIEGRDREAQAQVAALAATEPDPVLRAEDFSLWANMTGDPVRATGLALIARAIDPQLLTARYELVIAEAHQGHDEAALANAREALSLPAPDRQALIRGRGATMVRAYARLLIDQSEGDFARAMVDEAAANETPARKAVGQARSAAALHDLAGARMLLAEGAATGGAGQVSVLISRYEVAAAAEDWRAAAAAAAAVIAIEDASRKAATEPDEAIQMGWFEAVSYRPRLAEALARLGDFTGAGAAIAPAPLDCYLCDRERGRIAMLSHDFSGAARWLTLAARLGPSLPFAHLDLAELDLDRGDPAAAIGELQLAAARAARLADVDELWGRALAAEGDFGSAAAKFAAALAKAPHWSRCREEYANALRKAGGAA